MTNRVKDRSGAGLPPKTERRAAGKVARERRLKARRRAQLARSIGKIVLPLVAVAAIVLGVAALGGAFSDDTVDPSASASSSTGPDGLDPALQTQPVVTAGTGELTELKVETLITGTGPKTAAGQSITANYIGVFYATGEKFGASWDDGQPLTFQLGTGGVIPGWDQGLVGVPVGSRVQLDIPTDLAYGADAEANNKPAGPLRFVVDILEAK